MEKANSSAVWASAKQTASPMRGGGVCMNKGIELEQSISHGSYGSIIVSLKSRSCELSAAEYI